ncbi:MAG: hypothetical protein ACXVEE_42175 [Polyangiales bacterium]
MTARPLLCAALALSCGCGSVANDDASSAVVAFDSASDRAIDDEGADDTAFDSAVTFDTSSTDSPVELTEATIGFYREGPGYAAFGAVATASGIFKQTDGVYPPATPFGAAFDVFAGDAAALVVHARSGGERHIGAVIDGSWSWTGTAPARTVTHATALGPGRIFSLDAASSCIAIEAMTKTGVSTEFERCDTLAGTTNLVGTASGDVLAYDRVTGKAWRAHWDASAKKLTTATSDAVDKGWSRMVVAGGSALFLGAPGKPRAMVLHAILPPCDVGPAVIVGGDALLADYTHVASLKNGLLLFYQYGAARVETGRIEGDPPRWVRLHATDTGSFSTDWDQIFGL